MKRLFYLLLLITSNSFSQIKDKQSKSISKKEYQEWNKKNHINTNTNSNNGEFFGKIYYNKKYKFRIELIKNWEVSNGDGKSIIIANIQRDSGKTVAISVQEYPNFKFKPIKYTQSELEQFKQSAIELAKVNGIEMYDVEVKNGYLANFNGLIFTYKNIEKTETTEIEYYTKKISCVADGKMYAINISMPYSFYNSKEQQRMSAFIASFKFTFL